MREQTCKIIFGIHQRFNFSLICRNEYLERSFESSFKMFIKQNNMFLLGNNWPNTLTPALYEEKQH